MNWIEYTIIGPASLMFGIILGIVVTKRIIENAIEKADICRSDKMMIRDVLGIPNHE